MSMTAELDVHNRRPVVHRHATRRKYRIAQEAAEERDGTNTCRGACDDRDQDPEGGTQPASFAGFQPHRPTIPATANMCDREWHVFGGKLLVDPRHRREVDPVGSDYLERVPL